MALETYYKLAFRGNYPQWEDMHNNPYRKSTPGDGTGMDLMTPGGEEQGGGFGTRARKGFPHDFSETSDEYERQRQMTIPESWHMFMGPEGKSPLGDGGRGEQFVDYRDRIPKSPRDKGTARGPHNMQGTAVFKTTRRKLRGVLS